MILTFIVPSRRAPVGGNAAIYEFANALVRRQHDVNVIHVTLTDELVLSKDELAWFEFEEGVRHYFFGSITELPSADFVFGFSESFPPEGGLPLVFVLGVNSLRPELDNTVFTQPCPHICIGRWLLEVGRRAGVPDDQLVYVPHGIKHEKYRVLRPIEGRPPRVAMCYSTHRVKGAAYAIEAVEHAKEQVPELTAVLFSTQDLEHRIPDWMTYLRNPAQETIVHDVYNGSRVFVTASLIDGFGMPSAEAMACGCALVTTDNGGSDEFAIHGETALVSAPRDADTMASNIVTLITDDAKHVRLARAGNEYVRQFNWDDSAGVLEAFLVRYKAEPQRYRSSVQRSSWRQGGSSSRFFVAPK
jgi:glycosyltransferase involved in cell wall biosynthesis